MLCYENAAVQTLLKQQYIDMLEFHKTGLVAKLVLITVCLSRSASASRKCLQPVVSCRYICTVISGNVAVL